MKEAGAQAYNLLILKTAFAPGLIFTDWARCVRV
jgi:hypothetical protein